MTCLWSYLEGGICISGLPRYKNGELWHSLAVEFRVRQVWITSIAIVFQP